MSQRIRRLLIGLYQGSLVLGYKIPEQRRDEGPVPGSTELI